MYVWAWERMWKILQGPKNKSEPSSSIYSLSLPPPIPPTSPPHPSLSFFFDPSGGYRGCAMGRLLDPSNIPGIGYSSKAKSHGASSDEKPPYVIVGTRVRLIGPTGDTDIHAKETPD